MYAKSRRKEKNKSFIDKLNNNGFNYTLLNDYTNYEEDNVLEGTGSVVWIELIKLHTAQFQKDQTKDYLRNFALILVIVQ